MSCDIINSHRKDQNIFDGFDKKKRTVKVTQCRAWQDIKKQQMMQI